MTHDPRTTEEIYDSLKNSLTGKIAKLTNFTDRSFNAVWTNAFSEELRKLEIAAVVSELAGFIDYSGGPVTQEDLEELGYGDVVDADEVNELMEEQYLDEFIKLVGVERFEGAAATGEVTFTTQSAKTQIPEGTRVTTRPDSDGATTDFVTTEKGETAAGETSTTIPIEAILIGEDGNVPAETIIRLDDPPIGVLSVINNASTTGGEDRETNEELRTRAKNAVEGSSEGGTVSGIKAFITQDIEAVREGDVLIEEFYDEQPPFVDVIVDGGSDTNVTDAIEDSRPAGIRHNLVRPEIIQIDLDTALLGQDIDTTEVNSQVEDWLLGLGIGENFYQDELIRQIMESDDDIINVGHLGATIGRVTNERYIFDTELDRAIADDGGTLEDETPEANNDTEDDITLLPTSPATGDAYYFGENEVFSGFDIDISTAGSGTWDVVWEYYDGSNWVALSNVSDGTNDFRNIGLSTISWDVPTDWVKTTINGSKHYYVRARLDTFSSISQQPFGEQVFVTGNSYELDYTYEHNNGANTVEDSDGTTYTEGTDYSFIDRTGDGWPETLVWLASGTTPVDTDNFNIDYDVTTTAQNFEDYYDIDLIRDEKHEFTEGASDEFTYDTEQDLYELSVAPFESSVSIEDNSGDTYDRDVDFEVVDDSGNGFEQTINWDVALDGAVADDGGSTTDETTAANDDTVDDMTLLPSSPAAGDAYYFGHDTQFDDIRIDISTAGAGTWDVVWEYYDGTSWVALSGVTDGTNDFRNSGVNEVSWTVPGDWSTTDVGGVTGLYWVRGRLDTFSSLSTQPLGKRADQDETPDNSEDYTASYNQKVYHLEYEIQETPSGELTDASGDLYEQDVDYEIVDHNQDTENDSLNWLSNPSTLEDGEEFYITYLTEGDIRIENREKIDPGNLSFSIE